CVHLFLQMSRECSGHGLAVAFPVARRSRRHRRRTLVRAGILVLPPGDPKLLAPCRVLNAWGIPPDTLSRMKTYQTIEARALEPATNAATRSSCYRTADCEPANARTRP